MAGAGDAEGGGQAIDPKSMEHLSPGRFISLTFPNPNSTADATNYSSRLLRFGVLDSPFITSSDPDPDPDPDPAAVVVAAMLVPVGREDDWIFSTETGQFHLLQSLHCSRFILVGNNPSQVSQSQSQSQSHPFRPYARRSSPITSPQLQRLKDSILPLLLALSPRSAFKGSIIPAIPFLSYEDDHVATIVPVDHLVGPVVGEMLVEDVEIDDDDNNSNQGRQLRRRLRFKRMPNLVQTQVRLCLLPSPDDDDDRPKKITNTNTFRPESASLVQPYLGPMVAGLWMLPQQLHVHLGQTPKALCLGVGGGALLMCLRHQLGFSVTGVEADDVVLTVAKRHFGLTEDEYLSLLVGDAIQLMESRKDNECLDVFDVVMVDLDSGDALTGITAPPLEFVKKSALLGVRSSLRPESGIMIVNVIPPNVYFYKRLVDSLSEVFVQIYEIDVGNAENYVLVATVSPVGLAGRENNISFYRKLNEIGAHTFLDCIKKI